MAGSAFDVFFSYNSQDKATVLPLAEALGQRGLAVWLDEEQLPPGLPHQPLLEQAIRESRSVAVLVGQSGIGPWENEEMQAALALAVRDKRPVIPVLLSDTPTQPNLPLFLSNRTWVDLRPAISEAGLDRLQWGITGVKPKTSHHAPASTTPLPKPPAFGALALWREKLDFLLREEAIAADAAQRFALKKQIEEARQKIRDLGA